MPCCPVKYVSSIFFWAPIKLSMNTISLISSNADKPRLLKLLCGPPAQKVSSLSCSSSSTTPPNTIAPMREFPTGRASVHVFAGRLYHNLRSCAAMLIVASSNKFNTINFFILIRYYSVLFAKLHHFPHIRI